MILTSFGMETFSVFFVVILFPLESIDEFSAGERQMEVVQRPAVYAVPSMIGWDMGAMNANCLPHS